MIGRYVSVEGGPGISMICKARSRLEPGIFEHMKLDEKAEQSADLPSFGREAVI